MNSLALLFCGFSVFCALSLAITHFGGPSYQKQTLSRTMGIVLLLALSGLQIAHFAWLNHDQNWVDTVPYRMIQFAVGPAFFLFSLPLLHPRSPSAFRPALIGHALPVIVFPFFPDRISLPLVFIVGAGYLVWLARSLYALRQERALMFSVLRLKKRIWLLPAHILTLILIN